jgi:hypothetical protein
MKTLLFFLCLAACAVSASGQAAPKWIDYTSAEGQYSVSMPKKPTITRQKGQGGDGTALDQVLAQANDTRSVMVVAHFDYPAGGSFDLDKARDGALSKAKGTLVSENDVTLGDFPGRNLVFDAGAGEFTFRVYARFYDAGGSVYMLQYLVDRSDDGPFHKPRIARFFNSFRVLPRQ